MSGPYPTGGGAGRFPPRNLPPGGGARAGSAAHSRRTGITGWPGDGGCRLCRLRHLRLGCRLVWCVKTEADYLALASRLPRATSKDQTVGAAPTASTERVHTGRPRVPGDFDRKGDTTESPHRAVEEKEILVSEDGERKSLAAGRHCRYCGLRRRLLRIISVRRRAHRIARGRTSG